MRVLVAKDGKVLPGQEELFKKLVEKNKLELLDADAWCRSQIPGYIEEMERKPILDWDAESEDSLFSEAERFGDGTIYYDDSPVDDSQSE